MRRILFCASCLSPVLSMLFCSRGFSEPEISFSGMTVTLVCWPDTLIDEEVSYAQVRVTNSQGEDLTFFPQAISWLIAPTNVAGLAGTGDTPIPSRYVVAFSPGQAQVTIKATYFGASGKETNSSTTANLVVKPRGTTRSRGARECTR